MKKKIHQYIGVIVLVYAMVLGVSPYVFAGDATSYKVTLLRIELKKSDGNWVTITSPNQEIDLAAVGQNSVAGALSNVNIPPGGYINFKAVLSETMKFSGGDGAGHNTLGGGAITLTGDGTAGSTTSWAADPPVAQVALAEASETHTAGAAGEVTATLDIDPGDADNYIEISGIADLATSVIVGERSKVNMFFDFDTQNTVHYVAAGPNDIMFFTPPQTGTEFGITVDGLTLSVTAANMKIDF